MYFYIVSYGIFIVSLFVSNVNWNMGNMQINFEGRETAKTALYFRISSYRLSAKSLVNKGFSCIL